MRESERMSSLAEPSIDRDANHDVIFETKPESCVSGFNDPQP